MKRASWAGILCAAVLGLAGCGDNGPPKLKIGVAGPTTGSDAAFGTQIKNGAEQAVADINAAGGIKGQQVELELGDDAGEPRQGVSVANNLVGEGVHFVVGHFNSGVSIPASEVYAENGVLMVTPGSTNPMVTDRGLATVFRTCGRDDQQGGIAGAYIAKNFAGKKIAIAHDKTPYGKGLADETKKALNGLGVNEVLFEGVGASEKDFSALIAKVKNAGADLFYWGGVHTAGGLILRQMREQGVNAIFMSGDGIASDEFAAIAGPAAEGVLMTFAPDPQKRPEVKPIVDKFLAKNYKPEAYTLYSYATVQVLKQAIEGANSTDPKAVADYMHSGVVFHTIVGDIAFDKKGDLTGIPYVIYTWKKQPDGHITYEQNG
jgi:branched-chain amino acid transport system substrate-binding protein